MKRIITFMMALALVLSLSVTAFAAGGETAGSITITNATTGQTYSVYKIFNATYNEAGNIAYTLEDSTLEAVMFGVNAVEYYTAADENGNTERIGKAEDFFDFDATTKVVTLTDGADQAKLFSYLGKLVEDGKVTLVNSKKADGTVVKFDGLETGYYVINRSNGTANGVTITTTKPTAEVHDKNHLPGDLEKTSDKESASVGDTINWTLEFQASQFDDGEKVLNYTIWDKLTPSGWAEIDKNSIKVYVDGTKITDWSLAANQTVNGEAVDFKIDIPWANTDEGKFVDFKYGAVVTLKVEYSAIVKDAAVANDPTAVKNMNTADLEWDTETQPDVPGEGDETETEVYNMGFTKVDGATNAGLAGAEFDLYRMEKQIVDGEEADVKVIVNVTEQEEGLYIVAPNGTDKIVSPDGGKVVIQGLAEGTYYLEETKAPEGYNKLDEAKEVIVGGTGTVDMTIGETTYKVSNAKLDIANNSGVELPSTGGMGTMMMISFGTMVAIAFAVLMITQKKMSVYRD